MPASPQPALLAYHNTGLFSDYFLEQRLPEVEGWDTDSRVAAELQAQLRTLHEEARPNLEARANEAQTEQAFIRPLLDALGFVYDVQTGLPAWAGAERPDYAVFPNREALTAARFPGGDSSRSTKTRTRSSTRKPGTPISTRSTASNPERRRASRLGATSSAPISTGGFSPTVGSGASTRAAASARSRTTSRSTSASCSMPRRRTSDSFLASSHRARSHAARTAGAFWTASSPGASPTPSRSAPSCEIAPTGSSSCSQVDSQAEAARPTALNWIASMQTA